MIPPELYDQIRTLNAPAAKTLREAWLDGPCSGAKITIVEATRLYELAGDKLARAVTDGLTTTRLDGLSVEHRNAHKKKARKKKGKKR